MIEYLPLLASGDKMQILDFPPTSQDLGSLGNMRGGLFKNFFILMQKTPYQVRLKIFEEYGLFYYYTTQKHTQYPDVMSHKCFIP